MESCMEQVHNNFFFFFNLMQKIPTWLFNFFRTFTFVLELENDKVLPSN